MRIPALVASVVLVFGLAGCGGAATTQETASAQDGQAQGGQVSADAAGQAFLHAFGTGDARGVCAVMAAQGVPVESSPAIVDKCASALQGTLDTVKEHAGQLSEATVTGATVSGDTATFENATITPELGKSVLGSQSAVQINGKWYIGAKF